MAPSSEPQTPSIKCRPPYHRSCASLADCHPAQMARAQLGDTKGTIVLPMNDSPPSSPALSTTVSIFGSSRAVSPVSSTTSSPALEVRDLSSCQQQSSNQGASRQAPTYHRSNPKRRRLTPPSSRVSDYSSSSNSTGQKAATETESAFKPSQLSDSSDALQNAGAGGKVQIQRTTRQMDGACEEISVEGQGIFQKRQSVGADQTGSSETIRVHFAADEQQQRYKYDRRRSFPSHFLDPFACMPAKEERRFSDSSTASAYLRPNAFAGHRDTLARLHRTPSIDTEEATQLDNPLALSVMPAVSRVPAEVLHHIYQYLQPCDFDAARHTCRSWFLAGLDRRIGHQMMKMAGCAPAFAADLEYRQQLLHSQHLRRINQSRHDHDRRDTTENHNDAEEHFSEEWLVSKRLATECRLSAAWHGSGLSSTSDHSASRFTVTKTVNFDKLVFPSEDEIIQIKRFTVSVCGKFLLVTVGTDIFVYSIGAQGSALKPCVRLVAGKEILSVSMDTSSGRYAVAALLSGRMGMCWELKDIFRPSRNPDIIGEPISLGFETDVYGSEPSTMPPVVPFSLPARQEECHPLLGGSKKDRQSYFDLDFARTSLYASPTQQSSNESLNIEVWEDSDIVPTIPIRTKPTHIYKNLGCPADGPRSVAICPQRKCVAFGCRAGIELHWVDALTGRNLNRWFPLAAPSDHLYFLPPRPTIDTSKKLRLISSASGPSRRAVGRHNSTPANSKFSPSGRLHGRHQSMTRLFYGDLPFPSGLDTSSNRPGSITEEDDEGVLRTFDCDHYHAVPLSDGVHMLFTDPKTGFLCLGSDAPLGGPTKLIRKVCMIPPTSNNTNVGSLVCYGVAQDLNWGVRVIAAYEDGSIVLYNVPSDCFERIRQIRASTDVWDELTGVLGESDLLMDAFMANQHRQRTGTESTADAPTPSSPSSFRSLQINGAFVCRVDPDVEDLQIDAEGGGLRLWIFHHNGQARKMDIFAPRNYQPDSYTVGVDGLLDIQPETKMAQTYQSIAGDTGKSREGQSEFECDPKHGIRMFGLDGACDYHMHCDSKDYDDDLKLLEELNTQSVTLYPDAIMTPPLREDGQNHGLRLQLEVLTDWRDTVLLDPYLISLD